MIVETTIAGVRETLRRLRRKAGEGAPAVGFVPTMGYLHEGHAALIRQAAAECAHAVVSVFVNPLQFGPNEDLERYPRDLERDESICAAAGAQVLFAPDVDEMYGDSMETNIHVDHLGDHLDGARRPGHFDGVCTVVAKLLQIVQPERVYFGRKDAQQWRIVRRMMVDLSIPAVLVPCETVRETDGLALSSRNVYLTPQERAAAPILYRTLRHVRDEVARGRRDVAKLREEAIRALSGEPLLRLDYLEFVDGERLSPIEELVPGQDALCVVAAYFGKARLIDNVELVDT